MIKFTHFMPFAAMLCLSLFFSCTSDIKPYSLGETFTDDRDGKVYRYATIGTQTWMAQNLNYDVIGSKCAGNSESNCAIYGRLYNWQTAMNVCPTGWHLPSDDEWQTLVDFAGGDEVAGKILKASGGWGSNSNGKDIFGFSALPSGAGYPKDDGFYDVGNYGYWWSEDGNSSINGRCRIFMGTGRHRTIVGRNRNVFKGSLHSVRCVKD
jgi:uncharacterized protein (TIGR02145 family)